MKNTSAFLTILFYLTLVQSKAQTNSSMKNINENAPVKISKTITINASPAQVWSVLADINNWNQWLTMVKWARLNGPLEPGTTFDWNASGSKIHSTLHTVDTARFIGWTGKVYGVKAIHNWSFREVAGGTEIICSESMEGFLAGLFKKSMNKMLAKDMQVSLEQLKSASESISANSR